MGIDGERAKTVRAQASLSRIENVASRLRGQWSAAGHCMHNDWHALAQSVGLSSADIPALQTWVRQQGRRPPSRPKPKGGNL